MRTELQRMHDLAHYPRAFVERMCARYAEPIGEGRHRIVFRDGDEVIKVPTSWSGSMACEQEISESGTDPNLAKAWQDEELSEEAGFVVERMEYVAHTGWSDVSDWTWYIDGGQVGRTSDGRLVAYDWDRC